MKHRVFKYNPIFEFAQNKRRISFMLCQKNMQALFKDYSIRETVRKLQTTPMLIHEVKQ